MDNTHKPRQRLVEEIAPRWKVAILEKPQSPSNILAQKEMYRTLVEDSDDAMFIKDAEGRYEAVNTEQARRLGMHKEDIIGRTVLEVFPSEVGCKIRAHDLQVLRTGKVIENENTIETPEGMKAFLVRKTPIRDDSGRVVGLLGISRDISDQKLAEEALRQSEQKAVGTLAELKSMQENLFQAEKLSALGQLVAGVAHELNNPLSAILGFTQLLLRSDLSPKDRQMVRQIETGTDRASKVVQNLLSFARKQEPKAEPVDLNQVLRQTLELKIYDLLGNQVDLELNLAPILPHVFADTSQMQSVFLNLISNAQDAIVASKREGTVSVKTEFVDDIVRIIISDDGPGIEPEHLSRIFDPFFTTKKKGTGLGLSICHGVVSEHGGKMWVESKLGSGTSFYLELPPTTKTVESKVEPCGYVSEASSGGSRILVIDDEQSIREVIETALTSKGHQVDCTGSPREALARLDADNYDLILADLRYPDMSGEAFYNELVSRPEGLSSRIIFITGDTASPDTKVFLERAGRTVIEKPFDLKTLQRRVAQELDREVEHLV